MEGGREKTMKKIIAVFALALAVLASVSLVGAQQGKVYRIGFLAVGQTRIYTSYLAAFRQGLRELGYVEGKNIVIEERFAKGRRKRLPALAEELVRFKADVIVVQGGAPARAADKAGRTIPIVLAVQSDPVGTGLVASLARPGGNITGMSTYHTDLVPKRLELLKEIAPSATRVAVLWAPAASSHPGQWKLIQSVAPGLGVTLLSLEVSRPEDFDRALATMRKERPGGLVVFQAAQIEKYLKQIVKFSLKSRLPVIYAHGRWVTRGGLMSYGSDHGDLYRRAATFVDKILKGSKPADLPVEQPKKFELVINLKTAKKIGITVPPGLLFRATKVIK